MVSGNDHLESGICSIQHPETSVRYPVSSKQQNDFTPHYLRIALRGFIFSKIIHAECKFREFFWKASDVLKLSRLPRNSENILKILSLLAYHQYNEYIDK